MGRLIRAWVRHPFFAGFIYTDKGVPLPGGKLSIGRSALLATSDAKGYFQMDNVPPGRVDLFVDGRAVNPTNDPNKPQWPSLHFEAYVVRGQKNELPHAIYLPALLTSEAKIVGGNADVVLTIPGMEGFAMKVKANSVTFPDGSRVGTLVVSPVTADKLPMAPPAVFAQFGAPGWTIQPAGTRFDLPIEVTMPNSFGEQPGFNLAVVQWDHDLAQFVPMGRATVSGDGALIQTDPGSGVTKAGWGGGGGPSGPNEPQCKAAATRCLACDRLANAPGGCPSCEVDRSKDNTKIKWGVFNGAFTATPVQLSLRDLQLSLRAEARGSAGAELQCCEGKGGPRKPTGLMNVAMALEGALEGPIPVPGIGLGITTKIPFGGTVRAGVVGKVGAVGEVAGEGEFNYCDSKVCGRFTGIVKLTAEIGPKIIYGADWVQEPLEGEFSASVGLEGGQQWFIAGCDVGDKKRFATAYIKAEYMLSNRSKFTIFNLSRSIEDTVKTGGGEFRPVLDNMFQLLGL